MQTPTSYTLPTMLSFCHGYHNHPLSATPSTILGDLPIFPSSTMGRVTFLLGFSHTHWSHFCLVSLFLPTFFFLTFSYIYIWCVCALSFISDWPVLYMINNHSHPSCVQLLTNSLLPSPHGSVFFLFPSSISFQSENVVYWKEKDG